MFKDLIPIDANHNWKPKVFLLTTTKGHPCNIKYLVSHSFTGVEENIDLMIVDSLARRCFIGIQETLNLVPQNNDIICKK